MIRSRTTIPKGFRFHPLEEELVCDYLEKKNQGSTDSQITDVIPELDVCKHEPRAIPALVFAMAVFLAVFLGKESYYSYTQWHFFSPRDYKYSNSTRSNRTTEQGFWKITSKDRAIKARGSNVEIGRKRTLTFYLHGDGEKKAKKTDWVIHEYYLTDKGEQIGDFVLCCLKNKSDKFDHDKDAPFFDGGEPGMPASNVENQAVMITEAEENPASKELGDAVQITNDKEDAFNGLQIGSCLIDKNQLSNCVEGQPDSCNPSVSDMIDELLDDPENLDSLFLQRPPPQELGNVSNGNDDEAEPCSRMLTEEEEIQAFQELIKLLDDHEPENLDSLFPQPPPLHPHQLPQPHPPQDHHPSILQSPIYEQPGNVSHATNVSNDESHKRKYPFGDNDPSPTKKNNISTDDDDELGSNTASNSDNQAAYRIPEGANLGLVRWDQPQALLSINGGPRDSVQNNNFIELDDLPSSFEDFGSFLEKFSDTIIDTEVAHGSDMGNTSILSNIQSWHQTWEVLLEESDCRAASQAKVSEAAEHYIAVYLPQKKPETSPGSRQQFKAGSNLKGSFIFLDASPFNP